MPASHYACQSLQIRLGSFTSPAATDRCSRDCAAADIQVIGRKAHPPTSLNRGVGCQNEAVCDSSCLPDNLARLQMSVRPWPRKDSRSEHPRHNSGHAPTKRAAEHTCDKPEESRMRPCREPSSGARCHWHDRLRLTLSCRNHLMHSANAGYHGLGCAAGTVNCHHSGKPVLRSRRIGSRRKVVCSRGRCAHAVRRAP